MFSSTSSSSASILSASCRMMSWLVPLCWWPLPASSVFTTLCTAQGCPNRPQTWRWAVRLRGTPVTTVGLPDRGARPSLSAPPLSVLLGLRPFFTNAFFFLLLWGDCFSAAPTRETRPVVSSLAGRFPRTRSGRPSGVPGTFQPRKASR